MHRKFLALAFLGFGSIAAFAQTPAANWVGTWAASPVGAVVNDGQPSPANSTYRNIVHISLGGSAVRVQLTNEFGTDPLTVGSAHIAVSAGGGSIQANSDHALTFNGRPTAEVPAGAFILSDPVNMEPAPLSDLVVSVYFPEQRIRNTTCHSFGDSTNYMLRGDATSAPTADNSSPIYAWCFVKGIDVRTNATDKAAAIVTFGDSITDGADSTRDANHRWPDVLAARLQADKKTANLGVLNQGIGGNRVLHDGYGPSALARFDRDVIAQTGVKYLIILEGINDIGRLKEPHEPGDKITADDLIFGLSQLVTRAHQHGIKVFGATLTPYLPTGYSSPQGEQVRQAYNQWITTSGVFDGVIDFDKITQDPAHPDQFLPDYDSGDHLHPKDAGYKAMGDAIDLSLFH
ncbi:SGNH/GDSL hydrolase family protein [Alloacidobacterium dinghuense]|uniref:SGNH/GDSL hydrolase family protein n=1 Tax=Alloacidobacterium dinghuense TaxID=2763107 RepID=A0A7G8BJB6_9BACT|nr:SGNH/GDSL hydrolase family protein [Alloacidobacterium dinghuense]QNI32636.1 SGNH/GDSL hydrolase family protein [Alloacidobacterium dinghuense]